MTPPALPTPEEREETPLTNLGLLTALSQQLGQVQSSTESTKQSVDLLRIQHADATAGLNRRIDSIDTRLETVESRPFLTDEQHRTVVADLDKRTERKATRERRWTNVEDKVLYAMSGVAT